MKLSQTTSSRVSQLPLSRSSLLVLMAISLKASPAGGATCDDIWSYSFFLLLCRVHKSRLAHSPSPTIVPDVA
jgi:hypothetical protein